MAEQSDLELVILARMGDKLAFGALIERYQVMLEHVAMRMVSIPDAAQDLVQEAMLQAYLSLKDLRDEDRFRSWLYGILLNVTKSYLRSRKRADRFSDPLDDDQPPSRWNSDPSAQDPQEVSIERELHQLVLLAIEELPPAHREAARLYYYESLTLQEVAAITGASPGAIKVRLHRARGHLRERIRQSYPDIQKPFLGGSRRKSMEQAKVVDIHKQGEVFVAILQGKDQNRFLPIWIGPQEGTAIAMGLQKFPTPRPMTFDFIIHLLDTLDAKVEEVRVELLKDNIFYGVLKLSVNDEVKEIDARPSDILAIAVRNGSPIFVSEEVMQQAGISSAEYEEKFGPYTPGEGVQEILKKLEEELRNFVPPPDPA